MKKVILLAAFLTSAALHAGSGGGGGIPPALQEEMAMLMSSERNLSLMMDERNNPLVLSRIELPSTFTLTSSALMSNNSAVSLTAGQFVDAVQTESLTKKSYVVTDGSDLGSYELTDRLLRARNSVKNSASKQ